MQTSYYTMRKTHGITCHPPSLTAGLKSQRVASERRHGQKIATCGYFTTSNFIRHEENLVDLTEYRRKLAQAQAQTKPEAEEEFRPVRTRTPRRRRVLPGMLLDYAASAALIIAALSFAAKIL